MRELDVETYLRRAAPGLYAVIRALAGNVHNVDEIVATLKRLNPALAENIEKILENLFYDQQSSFTWVPP